MISKGGLVFSRGRLGLSRSVLTGSVPDESYDVHTFEYISILIINLQIVRRVNNRISVLVLREGEGGRR